METKNGTPVAAEAARPPLPLLVEQLRWRCDPARLGFETTESVPPLMATVGQERGVGAIELGVAVDAPGYNVFVAGPSGTGRTTTVRQQLADAAHRLPPAPDWCYLHNFDAPSQPVAVQFPAGTGAAVA